MVPKLQVGFATWSGVLAALMLAGGAVYAAVQERTTESVTAAVGAIATFLTVLGGRYAQAVSIIRNGVAPTTIVKSQDVPSPFPPAKSLSGDVEAPGDEIAPVLAGNIVDDNPPPDTGNDRAVKP